MSYFPKEKKCFVVKYLLESSMQLSMNAKCTFNRVFKVIYFICFDYVYGKEETRILHTS